MNLTQLLEYIRFLVEEKSANVWTDDELVSYLNRSHLEMFHEASQSDSGWGLDSATLDDAVLFSVASADGGITKVTTPANVPSMYKIVRVERLDEASDPGSSIVPIGINQYPQFRDPFGYATEGMTWFLGGDRAIYINAKYADLTLSEWRIWYIRRWAPLVRFTVGAGVSATQFTVNMGPSHADTNRLGDMPFAQDALKGAMLNVKTDAVKASSWNVGQTITCSAWASSNLAADVPTFALTHTPDPAGDSITANDVLESIPVFDEVHHEGLCYRAAMRALDKEGNQSQKALVGQTYAMLRSDWINSLENRQKQSGRSVNFTGW